MFFEVTACMQSLKKIGEWHLGSITCQYNFNQVVFKINNYNKDSNHYITGSKA